jgi:hypothetical protein
MQENTEKPEDSDTPEKAGNSSDIEETPESSADESQSEKREGEVLPSARKKNRGCGFFIFILLLVTGGGGYLYYTNQIPPQIIQWIEPLIGLQVKQHDQTASSPVVSPVEKSPVILERKPVFEESPLVEESPIVEEKPPVKIVSPSSIETEHISGSPTEPVSEPIHIDYPAKISGNTTLLVEPDVEVVVEEPEGQERFVERAPVFSPPPSKPLHQPEKGERNEAVQAYLDFFESSLVKVGELVKTGFVKGKDFLKQLIG